jgi:hypothetical protein
MHPPKRRDLISWLKAMYSRWIKSITIAATLLAVSPLAATAEEEIEIHRGEQFTSPGAGHNEVLQYVRVITVDWNLWDTQPRAKPRTKPPLSFRKALELAEASLDPSETAGSDNLHVTKLELRTLPIREPNDAASNVAFYVATFQVNETEIQRAVLMDGTVLKPQLTRIPTADKDKR